MGYTTSSSLSAPDEARYTRLEQRRKKRKLIETVTPDDDSPHEVDAHTCSSVTGRMDTDVETIDETPDSADVSSQATMEAFCQTDEFEDTSMKRELERLKVDYQVLQKENEELRKRYNNVSLTEESLKEDAQKLKFYTGLHEWQVFEALFNLVKPDFPQSPKVSKFNMLLMFLMKLRLNLMDEDIATRFGIHQSTVSRNFHRVLDILAVKTAHLIKWPDRDTLRSTMPMCFRKIFKNCCVIIDCTEIFMERPSDLLARAQVWSNYKSHSTVKFLIGITPQGTISFVSDCVGGRMSDKQIVEESKLLNHLLPGDIILADRGFTCDEYARMAMAEVKTPPFTKGRKQLEKIDVDWSRELSILRIHVERVIGVLKQKYTILQTVLPIALISDGHDANTTVDKIVNVCCALVNLCPSVVPLD